MSTISVVACAGPRNRWNARLASCNEPVLMAAVGTLYACGLATHSGMDDDDCDPDRVGRRVVVSVSPPTMPLYTLTSWVAAIRGKIA